MISKYVIFHVLLTKTLLCSMCLAYPTGFEVPNAFEDNPSTTTITSMTTNLRNSNVYEKIIMADNDDDHSCYEPILEVFLNLESAQVKALVQLLQLENYWTNYFRQGLNTRQFLDSLHNFTNTIWFQGHDRLKPTRITNRDSKWEIYFQLFNQIGIVDKISLTANDRVPDYSIVLGTYEEGVRKRFDALIDDLSEGIKPKTNHILLLSSNRPLREEVEESAIKRLKQVGKEPTEATMMELVASDYKVAHPKLFEFLTIVNVETVRMAGKARATTSDTAVTLRQLIESQFGKDLPSVVGLATYSNQPYVRRQGLSMQKTLGDRYEVLSLGKEIHCDDKTDCILLVTTCLGEIARLVHMKYEGLFSY